MSLPLHGCIVRGRDPTHTNVLLVVIETETAAFREKAKSSLSFLAVLFG